MKFSALALSAAVLGASLSTASADAYWKAGDLVPAAQAQAGAQVQSAPVIEGRQAAPVTQNNAVDTYLNNRLDTNR